MFCFSHDDQVSGIVVSRIPINVVNNLIRREEPAKHALHHKPVLHDIALGVSMGTLTDWHSRRSPTVEQVDALARIVDVVGSIEMGKRKAGGGLHPLIEVIRAALNEPRPMTMADTTGKRLRRPTSATATSWWKRSSGTQTTSCDRSASLDLPPSGREAVRELDG